MESLTFRIRRIHRKAEKTDVCMLVKEETKSKQKSRSVFIESDYIRQFYFVISPAALSSKQKLKSRARKKREDSGTNIREQKKGGIRGVKQEPNAKVNAIHKIPHLSQSCQIEFSKFCSCGFLPFFSRALCAKRINLTQQPTKKKTNINVYVQNIYHLHTYMRTMSMSQILTDV